MLKTALLVILALFSGWLYRRGGSDKTWHGKERDWGCSLLTLAALWLFSKEATIVLNLRTVAVFSVVFLLSWGALSTYWKGDKPDCKYYHWFLHGLGVGLALLPLVFSGSEPYHLLYKILLRSFALGGIMMIVSEASDSVLVEELGRGAVVVATLPILFM